jgi:uncharacterized membrane protein YfcA
LLEVVVVVAALGLGGLVQTVAGFGSALVAMPILTMVISVRTAAPVQALLGFAVTATVLYVNRHGLRWREALRLVSGSVIGIPLGAWALKSLPAAPVTACLGVLLLGYGVFQAWVAPRVSRERAPADENPRETSGIGARVVTWCVGFSSGILGGAYATDGPPLIVYGSVKGWPKATFKSILQLCFLINGAVVVSCHAMNGLITMEVARYCLYGASGMLGGMFLGLWIDKRIDHDRFRTLLLWLVQILGLVLIARSIW